MAKTTRLFGKAPLTIVRTNSGSISYVYKGRPAPNDVSTEERKRLVEGDFLEEREVDEQAADPAADFDVNAGGSQKDTLAWVGEDKDRAKKALTVEQGKPVDDQRPNLVKALEKFIGD
jgi:hypothetical protein